MNVELPGIWGVFCFTFYWGCWIFAALLGAAIPASFIAYLAVSLGIGKKS